MARASLEFASNVPACSSGVRVGINRWSCSKEVMRFLSCQRQSFQSASGTWLQKPRPAERNCLREFNLASSPWSLLVPAESSFDIYERTISSDGTLSREGGVRLQQT